MRIFVVAAALLASPAVPAATPIEGPVTDLYATGDAHYVTRPSAKVSWSYFYDTSKLDHHAGTVAWLYLNDQSSADIKAETSWVYANHDAAVTIGTGANIAWLYANDRATVTAVGGNGSYAYFSGTSTGDLSGYAVTRVAAREKSNVNFAGQFSYAHVTTDAMLTLDFGDEVVKNWDPSSGGYVSLLAGGNAVIRGYDLSASGNSLSGRLENGTAFQLGIWSFACAEEHACLPDAISIADMQNLKLVDLGAAPGGGSAVPEPATWALMIGGFGLAGRGVRRTRQQQPLRVS